MSITERTQIEEAVSSLVRSARPVDKRGEEKPRDYTPAEIRRGTMGTETV